MSKHTVLIHGATGETGGDILDGLLEDGSFDVAALVRPQSVEKQATEALRTRGIKVVVGDPAGQSAEELARLITGYDTVISAVGALGQLDQLVLVDAAAKAGTKRFVPCGFTTISPPGGVMSLRDEKEKVHERIWYHHLPYTIIDVGYWYQISFPALPSGRVDYAAMTVTNKIYGDGNAPNLLIDKRDMGGLTARIIKDSRTLNKRVFTHADVLTQNEIWAIMEQKSGEKIQTEHISYDDCVKNMEAAREALKTDPNNPKTPYGAISSEYIFSKYVRQDNTPENAKYLGYLDTKELYPDFKPISFSEFVDELLAGKSKKIYQSRFAELNLKKQES